MKTTNAIIYLLLCVTTFFSCEEKMETEKQVSVDKANAANARIADYSFDGKEGDAIEKSVASSWIASYQNENPDGNHAHFFGHEIIQKILAEEGCVGIRMYYAQDDNGNRQIILIGVDSKGNDLLPGDSGGRTNSENIIGDMSYPCPTYCSLGNP